ncbi:hypothetical protein [Hydromonas duriensis]|uniref:Integral membrane protein DUF2282 n=1 Tax=Hydromonas duriensis TaxID=1527608 RepID=A0A4R6Y8Q1_9BURK|nr:hypothetical protein [Hydromonas duriensis]TDR31804.1 hypothetical protein DFR44_10720 [Hydromonas duriensis]
MKKVPAGFAVAVAAMFTTMAAPTVVHAEKMSVHCGGINSCKGTSLCKTATSACAGQNSCKGQGWISASSEKACTDQGGHVVP